MSDIIGKIKSELNIGRNAWIFLAFGLLLQTLVYTMSNDSTLSFISGLLGVFAVVLCSQRKFISYVFGIAQLLTFLVIVWQNNLYAKVAENVFYLLTMVIGIFIWKNNYKEEQVQKVFQGQPKEREHHRQEGIEERHLQVEHRYHGSRERELPASHKAGDGDHPGQVTKTA